MWCSVHSQQHTYGCDLHRVVLLYWWSASAGIQAWFRQPTGFLQCFDTVGLVIWPVNIIPKMTYNVLRGTLSLYTALHQQMWHANAVRSHLSVCVRLWVWHVWTVTSESFDLETSIWYVDKSSEYLGQVRVSRSLDHSHGDWSKEIVSLCRVWIPWKGANLI